MARLVLDTNVLVSAVLTRGNPRLILASCLDAQNRMLASSATIKEFGAVLARRKFGFSPAEVRDIVDAYVHTAEFVVVITQETIITEDPEDNRFLEVALDGRAHLIVSGDKQPPPPPALPRNPHREPGCSGRAARLGQATWVSRGGAAQRC